MFDWNSEFDAIYVINLPHRQDRLNRSIKEFAQYNIPVEIFPAIESEQGGAHGVYLSVRAIMRKSVLAKHERILIFEDDVEFVQDPNHYLAFVMQQLSDFAPDWHMLYLGPNTHKPLKRIAPNLLLAESCRGLHATAYSSEGMWCVLRHLLKWHPDFPIDVVFENRIQPEGHSFCTWPLLATQRTNEFSDIQQQVVSNDYIVERFNQHTKHLNG